MKCVYLYGHGGSGNHGCEALVRTTAEMLYQTMGEYPCVISTKPEQDKKYITNLPIQFVKKGYDLSEAQRIVAKIWKILTGSLYLYDRVEMKAISRDTRDSLCISVGGDNYCYSDYDYYGRMNQYLKNNNNETILWGCSIEPKLLKKKEVLEDLANYSLITARESLTYEALLAAGLTHVKYCPDTAFLLPVEETELPDIFNKEVVGINVSPMVMDYEKSSGMVLKNYIKLMEYVINETDMNIALIPHVVWELNDDLIPLKSLFDKFKGTGRVALIDQEKSMNCCQLKYIISRCRYMVTARTHASIAAYSTRVPTLVVGYSVKSKGIAKDIFGDYRGHVCPVQELKGTDDLTECFKFIQCNAEKMKEIMRIYNDGVGSQFVRIVEMIKREFL